MPQRTEERFLKLLTDKGFVLEDQTINPQIKLISAVIKRVYDEEGKAYKLRVSFDYGYNNKVVAKLPRTAYFQCLDKDDHAPPWRYTVKLRGKNKVIVFFDHACRMAVATFRNWSTKDSQFKQLAKDILDGKHPRTDNPGHPPQNPVSRADS
jgi:hypothetical protein